MEFAENVRVRKKGVDTYYTSNYAHFKIEYGESD